MVAKTLSNGAMTNEYGIEITDRAVLCFTLAK